MLNLVEEDEDDDVKSPTSELRIVSASHTLRRRRRALVRQLPRWMHPVSACCMAASSFLLPCTDCDLQLTQPARLGSKIGRRAVLRHVASVAAQVAARGLVAETNAAGAKS